MDAPEWLGSWANAGALTCWGRQAARPLTASIAIRVTMSRAAMWEQNVSKLCFTRLGAQGALSAALVPPRRASNPQAS